MVQNCSRSLFPHFLGWLSPSAILPVVGAEGKLSYVMFSFYKLQYSLNFRVLIGPRLMQGVAVSVTNLFPFGDCWLVVPLW
jgi:hypothetical protein